MEHPEHVSASGNRYILDIVDDNTSYCWAIPLANKSDAFPALMAWEHACETETNSKVGMYRSDNGELRSHAVRDWLLSRGTQHQFTAPNMSAQNGCVERLHRTLMGKARAMRSVCDIPVNRWDEFVLTAAYLTNRTPVKSQSGHTPYKHWHGQLPDLSHLREIGCQAFMLIQNQHNPKVFNRSIECVLIGYSPDSKAYHCYHRSTHKVVTSYHVSFIELHQMPVSPMPAAPPMAPASPPTTNQSALVRGPKVPTVLQHSERIPKPSERKCAADGIKYMSRVQQAVLDAIASAKHD